jgi:hypothetical protein
MTPFEAKTLARDWTMLESIEGEDHEQEYFINPTLRL